MPLWHALARLIDGAAEVLGRIGWLLILYCMIFGVTDVFLRYVMNQPSQWIGTTVQAAMVLIACTGGAYALKHDAFVKLDLFYSGASGRTKAVLDVLTAPFAFLFLAVLIWKGIDAAMLSIRLKQVTPTSIPIPIYPIKSLIPLAAGFVLLLVMKKFILDLRMIVQGEPTN